MKTTNKKILIIEDETAMAHALQSKLIRAGFEAEVVYNGQDGLALIQKDGYRLILLDLIMPIMDGFSVLEKIKEKKIKTPVIVLSNLSQDEDEKRAKALGAKAFFIKSNTSIATIVEQVKKVFK
jgi:DNA-binding response OmpR family regulator